MVVSPTFAAVQAHAASDAGVSSTQGKFCPELSEADVHVAPADKRAFGIVITVSVMVVLVAVHEATTVTDVVAPAVTDDGVAVNDPLGVAADAGVAATTPAKVTMATVTVTEIKMRRTALLSRSETAVSTLWHSVTDMSPAVTNRSEG